MRNNIVITGWLLLLQLFVHAQTDTSRTAPGEDTISQRIILIGDGGELTNGKHPVVDAARKNIPLDAKTTVLFLGDNLYKTGLPDREFGLLYESAKAVLDSQISIADRTPAKVYMIPGNHDWENGGRGGYDAIIRQQLYVDFLGKGDTVSYFPKDGCPGPDVVNLGKDVVLILFDSQWWLHAYDKPEIESDCKCKTKEELVDQIRDIATQNSKKLVLLACHHPFKSKGAHGGFFTLKQHIFPLTDLKKTLYIPMPIIGSVYPIARSVFGTPQDLKHPNYAEMIEKVSEAVKSSCPNVIFVSGHDHNLQHIKDSSYHYIVSGGGCKQQRTSKSKTTLFNETSQGFGVLEVSKNFNVSLTFYTVTDSIRKRYHANLLNFKAPVEDSTEVPKVEADPYAKYKDTTTVPASESYAPVKGLKKFFMGQNYRYEWTEPVNMRVFKIGQEKGGFVNYTLGGGRQTISMRLVDKNKKEWVLRTVGKKPTGFLDENLPGNVGHDLSKELTTATYPYSAMVFPKLAEALDIPVPKPELFFVPDDPGFGIYRKLFANRVCMLEERDPSIDGKETKSTAKVFAKMLDENDHLPDQKLVLHARLLDILTGDYDRHFDQWRWGTKEDTGKGKVYYPIPRDRDQAFFYSDGFILKIISGRLPFLKGFTHDIQRVNYLGYRARDFDRIFLTDLDAEEWRNAVAWVQKRLTDSVIELSTKELPPEVYKYNGKKLAEKMVSRREILLKEAMDYYAFVAKKVNVIGSNQKEYFKVTGEGGSLHVKVFGRSKGNDSSFLMYDRVFDPSVTKEIRLYGLNDEDIFDIDESAKSRIKLRLIGGRGNDTFDVRGNTVNLLYDLADDLNYVRNGSRSKNRFSTDPPLNDRSILGFNYNTMNYPQLTMGYNKDDGFIIGGGISARAYGFRNFPYSSDQQLAMLYAPGSNAFKASYKGEFNHITRSYDLLVNARVSTPALRNFFGYGSASEIDDRLPARFYQARYRMSEFELLFRKRFFEKFHLVLGPVFQQYNAPYNKNTDHILSRFEQLGLDSADIFSRKSYLGAKFSLLLDNRNNLLFPTRGVRWENHLTMLAGMKEANNYTAFSSNMTIYASLTDPPKLVSIIRFGGTRVISKNYEFFQAADFGANNDLPGFRKNRYAGRSSMYGGLEMRYKLFDINSYIVPGAFGLTGFYNFGRVWYNEDVEDNWHGAFGGGVYYMPYNLFIISATMGFAGSERMFNISLGTRFNLHF